MLAAPALGPRLPGAGARPPAIDALLDAVIGLGASDLHLTAGEVPMARVGGALMRLHAPAVDAEDLDHVAEAFHHAHETRYGYDMREEPVELVALRLVATVAVDKPALHEPGGGEDSVSGTRDVNLDGEWTPVDVHERDKMGAGSEVDGPAIVEFAEATCLVRPGWHGKVDDAGTLVLERS